MEPPCEHGGVLQVGPTPCLEVYASMEPPCEHGGVHPAEFGSGPTAAASMEPPCEHGGVVARRRGRVRAHHRLQWSRRVNTAECVGLWCPLHGERRASMEPPCEHGGVLIRKAKTMAHIHASMEPPCEHGGVAGDRGVRIRRRRAASMEPPCEHGGVNTYTNSWRVKHKLQWSRRVNTAEWVSRLGGSAASLKGFKGAAV